MHCLRNSFQSVRFFNEKLTQNAQSMLQKGYSIPDKIDISKTLREILRESLYHDPIVRKNCLKLLEAKKGEMLDKDIVEGTRVLAASFFCEKNNEKLREKYSKLSESFSVCKQNILKREVELMKQSMNLKHSEVELPKFEKCLYKPDLSNFYFKKQIELGNYEILKEILINYGDFIDLYESIEEICKNENTKKEKIFQFLMDKTSKQHFYLNCEEFEKLKKSAILCGFKIEKYDENEEVEYLEDEEIQKLIDRIVEFAKNKNEGFLRIEELEAVDNFVTKMKHEISKNNTVAIDALNYGRGRDPKNWKPLEEVFENLVFATRKQKGAKAKTQIDLYKKLPVLFCDKLSSDDMIVLYLAWKLGPKCRVITNDFYKDHRTNLCKNMPEILKIWDKWIIDAVYRHNSVDCEPLRHFNIRIYEKSPNCWIVPVIPEKPEIREINRWKISL